MARQKAKAKKKKKKKKKISKPEKVYSHAGRPTKYDPKYCELLIAFVKKTKLPPRAFCGHIEISDDTFSEWMRTHKEFSVAVKVAKAIGSNAMLDIAMRASNGKIAFHKTGPFAMIMKNCYGWQDNPPPPEEQIDDMIF